MQSESSCPVPSSRPLSWRRPPARAPPLCPARGPPSAFTRWEGKARVPPYSPGREPTAVCPQEVRAPSVWPQQAQGPSPPPRCSAPPAPAVLTPHCPRHRPQNCTAGGLWDRGPADSPGKEGEEGPPRTDSAGSLSQSTHCSRGPERAGWPGGGLNPFPPGRAPRIPGTLISAFPLPPTRCLRPSTITADSPGWTEGVLPRLPGGQIHSFSQKQDTGLVPKGPGSGSCFCCLTLLPVSDLVTAVHLLRQLLTALPHWPRSPGRETGDVSGKSRGTRDGGRVWRRLQSLGVLRVLPCSGRGAGQQMKPALPSQPPTH